MSAPTWDATLDAAEASLLDYLNGAIVNNRQCADHPLTRQPFVMNDDLQCKARQMAVFAVNGTIWVKPPSMMGHDPFAPQVQSIMVQASSATAARDELLQDPMACVQLQSLRSVQIGIGHFDPVWVLTFPSD
jgi:hypothetical protein